MDRNTLIRWAIISVLAVGLWKWGPTLFGRKHEGSTQQIPVETYVNAPGFVGDAFQTEAKPGEPVPAPPEGELCTIRGKRFEAELSSRGAALTHFWLTDPQYADGAKGLDISTTPDHERWRSLRTLFRGDGANDQLQFDRFPWTLTKLPLDSGCAFHYADADVAIDKIVRAGERPFELTVDTTIQNLSDAPKHHRFTIATYAFRTNEQTKGKMGRQSAFVTDLQCARDKDVTRKQKSDFKEGWFREPLDDRYAAVSNAYFAEALVPSVAYAPEKAGLVNDKPECALLAEAIAPELGGDVEADQAGAVYHADLEYPPLVLAPKQSATYEVTAFFGPKERDVLADAAGKTPRLGDLINLGFFTYVARILVAALVFFHTHFIANWGVAIIALTVCLRIGLFPLSWKQIQTTIAMRRIKPELDQVNKRFADDAQARQMAMMELYRKHGVNPLGGCLPQLVQLPIWWAMWATLQTAVEMYHEKFLWLTDLSAPDKYFILPLVYGVFIVLQQRIVPQQGMDPMQQKMMTYMMPGLFTMLVLFLPAALGLYMLTSSALGIVQQLAVEKIAPRNPPPSKGEIVVKQVAGDGGAGSKTPAFGKGNARV
ncbi:MAG TPA: membrane protein insertase YidC [Polyangiaceae bacterium]|jgi:YidC/Oxa1 family membrane protein insertase